MSVRDHERYREDVGAYLLGALPDLDRQAFERHLEGCPDCREDLERLRPAADALPRSVEPVAPPPSLKAALMDAIRDEGLAAEAPRRRPGRLPRPRWRARPVVAWAGAALLLVAGVAAGFGLARALDGDGTRTVTAQVDPRAFPGARASLSLSEDGEEGAILRVNGMPPPGRGRVYQAWVQRKGEVVPQPTFEVGRGGAAAVALPGDLSDAEAVMVTRERRPGARTPGEEPVLSVRL
jgi:hypothetical protein